MRALFPLCLVATVLMGCAANRPIAHEPILPTQQIEMIPEDRRPDLTGVVEVSPSYGHWGLEGWILYLQPHAASTPGLCDLPQRYVEAPGTRLLKPNDPDEVRTGLRWAILDRPLSGAAQDRACRSLRRPSRNVAWFAPDGEAQVAAGVAVLRDFISRARQNEGQFRASLMCAPEHCGTQRSNARKLTASMVVGMAYTEASENRPYTAWHFRLSDLETAAAGIEWVQVPPDGIPYLILPETPAPGRRVTLTRYPS